MEDDHSIFIPDGLNGFWGKKVFKILKSRLDFVDILITSSKLIRVFGKTSVSASEKQNLFKVVLNSSKELRQNRIFFVSEKKKFSLNHPFKILNSESNVISFQWENIVIDENVESLVTSIVEHFSQNYGKSASRSGDLAHDTYDFLACFEDHLSDPATGASLVGLSKEEQESLILFSAKLFCYLLTVDPGYIRYDDDPREDENDSKRETDYHPRYHLDIFFSKEATFKLGLPDKLKDGEFEDLLSPASKCLYVAKRDLLKSCYSPSEKKSSKSKSREKQPVRTSKPKKKGRRK